MKTPSARIERQQRSRARVLFLCTGNACRSQMAEGWARHFHGDTMDSYSAGTKPKGVDPRAVAVMREAGIDLAAHSSKHVDELGKVHFDLVVTVCDAAREACPVHHNAANVLHKSFDDPPRLAAAASNEEEALQHYRRVRDEIRDFVRSLRTKHSASPQRQPSQGRSNRS